MKRNFFLCVMAALVLGLFFAGCDTGINGNPGTLTVDNCPSSGSVVISDGLEPTTLMQLTGLLTGYIAVGQADNATSYRLTKNNGDVFDSSGDFLVILSVGGDNYFKKVSFNRGSGSVDFDSMTSQKTLPVN